MINMNKIKNSLDFFRDLRIRFKLLIVYSTIFTIAIVVGNLIVYWFIQQVIVKDITAGLKNTNSAMVNMVKATANASINNQLRVTAENNRDIVKHFYEQYQNGTLTEAEAKNRAAEILLHEVVGKTGYIYSINSYGIIKVHPDAKLIGTDISSYDFVKNQMKQKEGYLEYNWQNSNEITARPKVLYMTYFAAWDWIISVSAYREEFIYLANVNMDNFRDSILSVRFGKTGYPYVMDGKGTLIIHPQLQGTNIYNSKDTNGRLFIQDMCAQKTGQIIYPWQNPGEDAPREKIVVFDYIPEYDWIVASSSYLDEIYEPLDTTRKIIILIALITLILMVPFTWAVSGTITRPLQELINCFITGAHGDLSVRMVVQSRDEIGQIGRYFNSFFEQIQQQVWLSTGEAQLSEKMHGQQDLPTLSTNIVQQLCQYLNAQVGALYIMEDKTLKLIGSYAYTKRKNLSNQFNIGEGLIGQAALEKQTITLTQVPNDYIVVSSGLGETAPKNIIVAPFIYEREVGGVVEIGALTDFKAGQLEFIKKAMENIAIAFHTAEARSRIDELLAESRQQAEELSAQGAALRVANEELETQTENLRASESKLKEQQAELEATNVELEEKATALQESTAALEEKQGAIDKQNQELRIAQQELQKKAEDLALASKYKSEFLANMSHELRTPLNSMLILARMLASNDEGNLTTDQVESAQIIYSGGTDLLNLINEILDLAKVESGKMTFTFEPMPFNDLINTVKLQFTHVAEQKGLALNISMSEDLPAAIVTDQQRVKQIVKNLLSNSFKFTEKGSINLNIYHPEANPDLAKISLEATKAVAISVTDTGIGMTPDQQKIVFEAFQQADGSTSRQYGGTGLGLSISRELALKMGGSIGLTSEFGKGSTFTLYLPLEGVSGQGAESQKSVSPSRPTPVARPATSTPTPRPDPKPQTSPPPDPRPLTTFVPDDRDKLSGTDKVLLIVEDDPKFAKIVGDFAHRKGFKCLIAGDGESGLQLVKTYHPQGIILDLKLPRMSGWQVLETLKSNPDTRHIPVHIMSVDDETLDAYKKGAIGYLTKPVSQEDLEGTFVKIEQLISNDIKTLLLVEDDEKLRFSVKKLLGGSDVKITEASMGETALELLRTEHFDCMILDLTLPDMTGFTLLNKLNDDESIPKCPVIVYTGKALSEAETQELMKYADSVIVKGVKSPERLLDETALFLHRVVADMPADKQQAIKQLYDKEAQLSGKRILIVDDDARNSFALSKLLADKGLKVHIAQNGQKALETLKRNDLDLILMDIMMPVMDGFETIKRIRIQPKFRNLPILALTAKAMKGDREKCIAAGANDYLTKPIDPDRLFSMLRVWLYQ